MCGSTSWRFIVNDEKKVPSSERKKCLVWFKQFSNIVTCVEWKLNVRTRGLNFLTTSSFPQMTANSTAGGSICLHLTTSILRLHPRFSLGVLALTSQWRCSISKFSRLLIGVWEQKEHCVIIEASMVHHQTDRYFVQSNLRVQNFRCSFFEGRQKLPDRFLFPTESSKFLSTTTIFGIQFPYLDSHSQVRFRPNKNVKNIRNCTKHPFGKNKVWGRNSA